MQGLSFASGQEFLSLEQLFSQHKIYLRLAINFQLEPH